MIYRRRGDGFSLRINCDRLKLTLDEADEGYHEGKRCDKNQSVVAHSSEKGGNSIDDAPYGGQTATGYCHLLFHTARLTRPKWRKQLSWSAPVKTRPHLMPMKAAGSSCCGRRQSGSSRTWCP